MYVTQRDRQFFGRAAVEAIGGENKVRVGAVLTKGRTLLGTAHNTYRNPVANVDYGDATVHAERVVLKNNEHRFNCTLYVARLGLGGAILPSLPCADCMNHIIYGTAVSKVVYMDYNGDLVKTRV